MVDKIFNRVKVVLSEPSVQAALKKVREGLKTPNSRRAQPVQPPQALRQRVVAGVRQAAVQTVDVAREVGTTFRQRFQTLRDLSAAELRDAAATYIRGLAGIATARRALRQPTPSTSAQGLPPAPVAPPAPIQTPVPIVSPPPASAMRQRVVAPTSAITSATITTTNNYLTDVFIDPSNMVEWREVLRLWFQLKSMNRAMPPLIRQSERDAIKALSQNATMLHKVRVGAVKLASLGLGALEEAGGVQGLRIRAEKRARVWREERHTRYRRPLKGPIERGPRGGPRRTGSFYFNTKFRGARYKDFRTTNAASLEALLARRIESVRRHAATGSRWTARDVQIRREWNAAGSPTGRDIAMLRIQNRFRASAAARGQTSGTPGMYGYVNEDGGSGIDWFGHGSFGRSSRGSNSMLNAFIKGFFGGRGGFRGGRGR